MYLGRVDRETSHIKINSLRGTVGQRLFDNGDAVAGWWWLCFRSWERVCTTVKFCVQVRDL
jgi:hypothetical protein